MRYQKAVFCESQWFALCPSSCQSDTKLRRIWFSFILYRDFSEKKAKTQKVPVTGPEVVCYLRGDLRTDDGDFLPSEVDFGPQPTLGPCSPSHTCTHSHSLSLSPLPNNFDTFLMCPSANSVSHLHLPFQKMLFFFSPSHPVDYCSRLQKGHSAEVFSGSPLWTRRASAGIQGWKICVSGTRPRHHGKGNGKPRGKTTGR